MSSALEGEHYCEARQGNHSHYDAKNCAVCRLEAEVERLRGYIGLCKPHQDSPENRGHRRIDCAICMIERAEAAEAKLAAIDGLPRYQRIQTMAESADGNWIKYADIHAILRGEDT